MNGRRSGKRSGAFMAFQDIVDQNVSGLVAVERDVLALVIADLNGEAVAVGIGRHQQLRADLAAKSLTHREGGRALGIRVADCGEIRIRIRLLRDHEYDPNLMRLHVVGGGGCLVKHFGEYDHDRVTILDDICATARGYEYMAEKVLRRSGGIR